MALSLFLMTSRVSPTTAVVRLRSTLMALTDLDSEITEALANKSELCSLFFDMENTSPRVWSHHTCLELHRIGLRGNLPQLLQLPTRKKLQSTDRFILFLCLPSNLLLHIFPLSCHHRNKLDPLSVHVLVPAIGRVTG